MVGALADVLVHPRRCDAGGLLYGKRLAAIDRLQLPAIADLTETLVTQRVGDGEHLEHQGVGHHRRLVDDDDRVLHLRPLGFGLRCVRIVDVLLVLQHERVDRLRLDPGRLHVVDRHLLRLQPVLQVGDHLVLEGEAEDPHAFLARDGSRRLQHGRLARAGDTLHGHDAIGAGHQQCCRGELAGVELEWGSSLQPVGGVGCGDDRHRSTFAGLHHRQNAFFVLQRLRRGHRFDSAAVDLDVTGQQLALLGQLLDARLDRVDRDALEAQIQRGFRYTMRLESCLSLVVHANGRCDRILRVHLPFRQSKANEATVKERVARSEHIGDGGTGGTDGLHNRLIAPLKRAGVLALLGLRCGLHSAFQELLAVEAGSGSVLHPFDDQARLTVLDVQLGIAGRDGDAVSSFG